MQVQIIRFTDHPDKTVAMAARLCYSPSRIEELSEKLDEQEVERIISMLFERGHLSPFEHAYFTVGIEQLSRVASHQLVRSRIASYSQQSQRYIEHKDFEYVVPPGIAARPELQEEFDDHLRRSRQLYRRLRDEGIAKEDARFVLPQATASSIVMSKNARAWLEWFQLRTCNRSQWEIRQLAERILQLLKGVAPQIFASAGPPCVSQGFCREGQDSCGRIDKIEVDSLPFETATVRPDDSSRSEE